MNSRPAQGVGGHVMSDLGQFGIVSRAAVSAIVRHPEGSSTVLAVYVVLATHADRSEMSGWKCSVAAIAEEAGVSERSVHKAKAVLQSLGLLETRPTFTRDGDRGWDLYLLRFAPSARPEGTAESAVGGATVAVGGAESAVYSSDPSSDPSSISCSPEVSDCAPSDEFDEFWKLYPRRVGRAPAERALRQALKRKVLLDEILSGLTRWVAYWNTENTETKFVPYPATWLNQRRWEDPPAVGGSPALDEHVRSMWEFWLKRHPLEDENVLVGMNAIDLCVRRMTRAGFGGGEIAVRWAATTRGRMTLPSAADVMSHTKNWRRFAGDPRPAIAGDSVDYADAMERAYQAQRWSQ